MNAKKLVRGTVLTALCMVAMLYVNSTVSRAYWVVVKSDNTRVRNAASTDSDVMTAVNAGDRLDVISEEQGTDGKTWYKVSINNVSGYVRSDTVEKESEGGTGTDTTTAQAEPAASSSVVSMPSQGATVKSNDVNVRESASTNSKKVTTLQSGAAVTLTGTSTDSSGNTWYQVNFINNGSNVTGFIRNDYLELGEVVEAAPPTETPEDVESGDDELANLYGDIPMEEDTANNDYELFYEPETEGGDYYWYVHDNVARKKYKLEQLLRAEVINVNNMEIKQKEIGKLKIVLAVLAGLLVLALAAACFFGFRYFDLKDDDEDNEDDDDDDFVETSPARRRVRTDSQPAHDRERTSRTVQRQPQAGTQRRAAAGSQRRPETEGRTVQRRPETEGRTVQGRTQTRRPEAEGTRKQAPARAGSAQSGVKSRPISSSAGSTPVRKTGRADVEWKSKNFLADEEDDYSFINMDEDV